MECTLEARIPTTGRLCSVSLSRDVEGEGRVLTPAAEMFEMTIDDSTDIDVTLRPGTGTLRVVVADGDDETALRALLPSLPLDTRVTVTNGSITVFEGFVAIQEYSQPWGACPYEFELPVRDAVDMMGDVYMLPQDDTDFGRSRSVAYYLVEMTGQLGVSPGTVCFVGHADFSPLDFLSQQIQREWFVEETDGDGGVTRGGMAWEDVWERILLPYALEMWMENGALVFRQRGGIFCAECRWSAVEGLAGGGSLSLSYDPIEAVLWHNTIEVRGTDNTVGWLSPYNRVTVRQSLDDRDVWALDGKWVTGQTLSSAFYHEDGSSGYVFYKATAQPGVTVAAYRVSADDGSYIKLSDTKIGRVYISGSTTYRIYGGMLGDCGTFESDNIPYETALPAGSSVSLFFAPGVAHTSYDDEQRALSAVSPVAVPVHKDGCLCLKASIGFAAAEAETTSGVSDLVSDAPGAEAEWGCSEVAAFIYLEDAAGNRMYYSGGASTWTATKGYVTVWFNKSGDIIGSYNDDAAIKVSYASRSISTALGGQTYAERARYKDAEGMVIPLGVSSLAGFSAATARVGIDIVSLGGDETLTTAWCVGASKTMYILSDISVSWHPVCVSGELPNLGEGTGGTYSAKLVDVPDDLVTEYRCAGEGEEAEIELDSFNRGDGVKEGNTAQPALPAWSQLSAAQWKVARRTLALEDMRSLDDYLYRKLVVDAQDASVVWETVGGGWRSWDGGGRRKFEQVL